jgi:hypothetical protein
MHRKCSYPTSSADTSCLQCIEKGHNCHSRSTDNPPPAASSTLPTPSPSPSWSSLKAASSPPPISTTTSSPTLKVFVVTGNVKEVKAVLSELAASFGSSPSGHVQVTSNINIPSPVNVVSSSLHGNLYLAHESSSSSSSTTPPWNPTLNDGLSAGSTSIESSFAPPPNNTTTTHGSVTTMVPIPCHSRIPCPTSRTSTLCLRLHSWKTGITTTSPICGGLTRWTLLPMRQFYRTRLSCSVQMVDGDVSMMWKSCEAAG